MGVLVGQRELLESEIDKIIFVEHSGIAFDLVKSKNICKYKYENGKLLIDKLCDSFKSSVASGDCYKLYYRKLIFDALTNGYSRSKKFSSIIADLEQFYKNKFDKNVRDCVSCLVSELKLYEKRIDGDCITIHDKKLLQNFFGVKEGFSRFIEKTNDLYYPLFRVPKLCSKNFITIDSKFKTAYDDAISIKKTHYGYLLCIFITDVASYVCDDTSLYNHALQRGESIYTSVDNSSYIPMFPYDITRNFFSLNSGSYKKTVAHMFKFSDNFDFISAEVKPAKIKVFKNYSFDDVDKILDGKMHDSNYDMICLLLKFADKMKSCFNLDYHTFKEQNGTVIRKNKYLESDASSIITISTLFLNSYIAEVMSKSEYPFIYRVNDTVLSDRLLNSSIYSVDDLGHIVNNGNCYGHVTNPIRSFASLLNQYFELMLLVDDRYKKHVIDKNLFIDEWSYKLSLLVDELNNRLFLNSEYRDSFEKIFGKQLTRKK